MEIEKRDVKTWITDPSSHSGSRQTAAAFRNDQTAPGVPASCIRNSVVADKGINLIIKKCGGAPTASPDISQHFPASFDLLHSLSSHSKSEIAISANYPNPHGARIWKLPRQVEVSMSSSPWSIWGEAGGSYSLLPLCFIVDGECLEHKTLTVKLYFVGGWGWRRLWVAIMSKECRIYQLTWPFWELPTIT